MLESEKLELAIYRYVKAVGISRSVSIPSFVRPDGPSDQFNLIVERLTDLRLRGCIVLTKYIDITRLTYDEFVLVGDKNNFFSGHFEIEIAPGGRRYFEELESKAAKERQSTGAGKIIFISCGQSTDAEKRLGKQIAGIVKSFGFEAFFAEEVQNLDGLDSSILCKLSECAAFITVLHPRGEITTPKGEKVVRASVWIEQEIAIAAYIQRVEKRQLPVVAFAHENVSLEGLRTLLHLNPTKFKTEQDVISQLPGRLNGLPVLHSHKTLPQFYNFGGRDAPINVTGKAHSAQGAFMDLTALVTIVNPTQEPMKIGLGRLVLDGKDRAMSNHFFRLKSHPMARYEQITLMGDTKEDYELHLVFPDTDYPSSCDGQLWLSIDGEEILPTGVRFS